VYCELELGVNSPGPTSHGIYRRHYLVGLDELVGVLPTGRLEQTRQEAVNSPEEQFCPDMSVN